MLLDEGVEEVECSEGVGVAAFSAVGERGRPSEIPFVAEWSGTGEKRVCIDDVDIGVVETKLGLVLVGGIDTAVGIAMVFAQLFIGNLDDLSVADRLPGAFYLGKQGVADRSHLGRAERCESQGERRD